jgi:hypothetical protein
MNGETKSGVSTISIERLRCARRDYAGPTQRKRRINGIREELPEDDALKHRNM